MGVRQRLAASGDVVIAAHGTTLAIPELSAGVIGGASHMLRLAPAGVVPRLVLTGDSITVEEITGHGTVHAIVDREDLDTTAQAVARRMLRHSSTGIRLAKQAMRKAENLALGAGYEQEHAAGQQASSTSHTPTREQPSLAPSRD